MFNRHMERNSSDQLPQNGQEPLEQGDPLWDLLGKASEHEADAFFARNVVRTTRQLTDTTPTWRERIAAILTPKTAAVSLSITAACVCALFVAQLQNEQPDNTQPDPGIVQTPPPVDSSTALTDLVIEESLMAAADDPTQFTHDEVVAMIGL